MTTHSPKPLQGVAAVDRALSVLVAFEEASDGLTLAAVASACDLYESTALRLLGSLMHAGFVKRLPDGRYVLGPRVLPLAEMYRRSFRLSDYVLPRLRLLTQETGECAGFYVREGDQRMCLHHVQPQRSVRSHVVEGAMFPLNQGAAGRVILAFDDGARGQPYDTIRKLGCAITQKERDPESAALACPVFAQGSRLAGAVSLVIPLYRFSDSVAAKAMPTLQRHAAALTNDLGGVWPYAKAPASAGRRGSVAVKTAAMRSR